MKIGVEAVGNKIGGGRRVLMDTLAAGLRRPDVTQITLWCSDHPALLADLPQDERLIISPLAWAEAPLGRLHWLGTGLAQACKSVDRVLCLNGVGHVQGVYQVNMLQQPLIFSPYALSTMSPAFIARMMSVRALTTHSTRRAHRLAVQTPAMAQAAHDQLHVPLERMHILTPDVPEPFDEDHRPPQGKDTREQNTQGNAQRFVYVGSMAAYKNVALLLRAFERLHSRHPNWTLTITGCVQGMRRPWLRDVGWQSPQAIAALLSEATALLMPSLAETVGLPMIEAMQAGCPVIAADLPYAHDVCQDAALYADPQHLHAWIDAIEALVDTPSLRHTLVSAGTKRVETLRAQRPYDALWAILCQES